MCHTQNELLLLNDEIFDDFNVNVEVGTFNQFTVLNDCLNCLNVGHQDEFDVRIGNSSVNSGYVDIDVMLDDRRENNSSNSSVLHDVCNNQETEVNLESSRTNNIDAGVYNCNTVTSVTM